jgi:hypothetical protein
MTDNLVPHLKAGDDWLSGFTVRRGLLLVDLALVRFFDIVGFR